MTPELIEAARAGAQMYAETHPRPPHVTQVQAAKMLNLSSATVGKMVRSGILRLNMFGQIPIGDIDKALTIRAK